MYHTCGYVGYENTRKARAADRESLDQSHRHTWLGTLSFLPCVVHVLLRMRRGRLDDKVPDARLGRLFHGLVAHAALFDRGALRADEAVDEAGAKGSSGNANALLAHPRGWVVTKLIGSLSAGLDGHAGGGAYGSVAGGLSRFGAAGCCGLGSCGLAWNRAGTRRGMRGSLMVRIMLGPTRHVASTTTGLIVRIGLHAAFMMLWWRRDRLSARPCWAAKVILAIIIGIAGAIGRITRVACVSGAWGVFLTFAAGGWAVSLIQRPCSGSSIPPVCVIVSIICWAAAGGSMPICLRRL